MEINSENAVFFRASRVALSLQLLAVPTSFILSVVISRVLGNEQRALFDLLLAASVTFASLLSCAVPMATTWLLAKNPAYASYLRRIGRLHALLIGLIVALLIPQFIPVLFPSGASFWLVMAWLPLHTAIVALTMSAKGWALGLQRGSECVKIELISRWFLAKLV